MTRHVLCIICIIKDWNKYSHLLGGDTTDAVGMNDLMDNVYVIGEVEKLLDSGKASVKDHIILIE